MDSGISVVGFGPQGICLYRICPYGFAYRGFVYIGILPTGDLPIEDLPIGDLPIGNSPIGDEPMGSWPIWNWPEVVLKLSTSRYNISKSPEVSQELWNSRLLSRLWQPTHF